MKTALALQTRSIKVVLLSAAALLAICSVAFGQDPLKEICKELESTEKVEADTPVTRPDVDVAELYWKRKKKFAIVISAYKSADSKSDLPFAEVDGKLIAKKLCAMGYVILDVLTNSAATRNNIQAALERAQKVTRLESGLLLVYYSGHGVVDEKKQDLWLQVYDQTPGDRHGIKLPEIIENAYPAKARGGMSILVDSCFSGKGTFSNTLTSADLRNIIILSSGSGDEERSYSITTGKDALGKDITASAFSYYFSEAIPKDWDKVDADHDGIITYGELRSYTAARLACAFRDKKIPAQMKPNGLPPNSDEIFAFNSSKARVFKTKIRSDLAVREYERLSALESQGLLGTEDSSSGEETQNCEDAQSTEPIVSSTPSPTPTTEPTPAPTPDPGPTPTTEPTPAPTPDSGPTPTTEPTPAPTPDPGPTPTTEPTPAPTPDPGPIAAVRLGFAATGKSVGLFGIGAESFENGAYPVGFTSVLLSLSTGRSLQEDRPSAFAPSALSSSFTMIPTVFQESEPTTQRSTFQEPKNKGITSADVAAQIFDVGDDYAAGLKATASGNFDEARSRLQKVWQKSAFDRVRVSRALGRNEIFAGKYVEAAKWYREALKLKPDEREPAFLNEVGSALRLAGDYADAELLFQRSIAELKKYSTDLMNDRTYIISISNLARIYDDERKYKLAEPLYQAVLKWQETQLGPSSWGVAMILNNLAGIYYNQGEIKSALSFSERSLTSMQSYISKSGEEDIRPNLDGLAMILVNQAAIYRDLGNLERPETLLAEAIKIDQESFGDEHPRTAEAFLNLAILRLRQGRPKDSESLFVKVISIQERTLGSEHPDLAFTLEHYGVLLRRLSREDEAVLVQKRVEQIKKVNSSNRTGNSGFFKKAFDWMDMLNPIRIKNVLSR